MGKFLTMILALAFTAGLTETAFATASSVTETRYTRTLDHGAPVRIVKLSFVGASSGGAIADVAVNKLHGYLMKVVTKPGATGPTDNYDIELLDGDAGADALNATLANRSITATQQVFPVGALGAAPLYVPPGNYTLHITNQSVNSATGDIWLYFLDEMGGGWSK